MSFMRGDLLNRVAKLVKGGAMEKPRWFDAVMKVPPQPKKLRCPKPPKIEFPEDPLVESYYERNPEAKLIPFRLQGFDPPIARRFARRQLELMGQGMPKHEARDMAERELKAEQEQLVAEAARAMGVVGRKEPGRRSKSVIETVQEEEMKYLVEGLETAASQKLKP